MTTSDRHKRNIFSTPDEKQSLRIVSKDRYSSSGRLTDFNTADTKARYSISYLPRGSEHAINTGNTLEEAQVKVVMFACEVERLSAQNYELVKENELLRLKGNMSQREKDLELKLTIVLAENEKLSQIVEELYEFTSKKEGESREEYERKIYELHHSIEDWKQRYQNLQEKQKSNEIENKIRTLEDENRRFKTDLTQKSRELETLTERLKNVGTVGEVNVLEDKIIWLVKENNRMKEEVEKAKNSGQNNERLIGEYQEKIRKLMEENEQLMKAVKALEEKRVSPKKEVDIVMRRSHEEDVKMTRGQQTLPKESKENAEKLTEKIQTLLFENEKLNAIAQQQLKKIHVMEREFQAHSDLASKLRWSNEENERLNEIVRQKGMELERFRYQGDELKRANEKVEELNMRIRDLLKKSDELANLINVKDREIDRLSQTRSRDERDQDTKGKLALASIENERLNGLLREKTGEIEKKDIIIHELRKRITEMENSFGLVEDLRVKIKIMATENERLKSVADAYLKKEEQWVNKVRELEIANMELSKRNQEAELRSKLVLVSQENERLNKVVVDRMQEIDTLRRQLEMANMELSKRSQAEAELRSKLVLVSQENERLNKVLVDRMQEIEALRRQLEMKRSEQVDLRTIVEENDRLKALIVQKEGEITNIIRIKDMEIERLNVLLRDKVEEIMRIERVSQDLRRRIEELERDLGMGDSLRVQLQLTSTENERLNKALMDRMQEIEALRRQLEMKRSEQVDLRTIVEENDRLKALIVQKEGEITNIIRIKDMEIERLNVLLRDKVEEIMRIERVSQDLRRRIEELERDLGMGDSLRVQLQLTSTENERLNALVKEYMNKVMGLEIENGELSKAVQALKGEHMRAIGLSVEAEKNVEELRSKLILANQEIERLNHVVLTRMEEIEALRRQVADLQREDQKREEIKALAKENERVRYILEEREKEIISLRGKLVELDDAMRALENIKAELQLLIIENERINRLLGEKNRDEGLAIEINELRATIQHLTMDVQVYKAETERLEALVCEKTEQNENISVELKLTLEEMDQLKKVLIQRNREIDRASAEEGQLSQASAHICDLQAQVDNMGSEIKRLVQLLAEKDQECNVMKVKIHELEERTRLVSDLNGKLLLISSENLRLLGEIDRLNEISKEDKTKELEARLLELLREKEDLCGVVSAKTEEIERLRRELENKKDEKDEYIKVVNTERIQEWEEVKNTRICPEEVESEKKKMGEMTEEIQKLSNMVNDKDNEIRNLKEEVEKLQGTIEEVKKEKKEVEKEKTELSELLEKTLREIEELRNKLECTERSQNEVVILRERLSVAVREIEEYRNRVVELESEISTVKDLKVSLEVVKSEADVFRSRLEDAEKIIRELEGKIGELEEEKRRLLGVIEEKVRMYEEELQKQLEARLNAKKESLEKELDEERRNIMEEKEQLEIRIQNIMEEYERIKVHLSQNLVELEEFKRKNVELEELRDHEVKELKCQIDVLQEMNREIRDMKIRSDAEKEAYEKLIAEFEITVKELESQNRNLVEENQRLTEMSFQRLKEYTIMKRTVVEIEELHKVEVSELKNWIEQNKANASDLKELTIRHNAERAADHIQINQLNEMIENYKTELGQLNEVLEQRKADLELIRNQNEELRQSQAQLVKIMQSQDDTVQEKFDLIQNELKRLEEARNEFKDLTQRNSVEFIRRSRELTGKIQELDSYKVKYEEAFNSCQTLNSQLVQRLSVQKE